MFDTFPPALIKSWRLILTGVSLYTKGVIVEELQPFILMDWGAVIVGFPTMLIFKV